MLGESGALIRLPPSFQYLPGKSTFNHSVPLELTISLRRRRDPDLRGVGVVQSLGNAAIQLAPLLPKLIKLPFELTRIFPGRPCFRSSVLQLPGIPLAAEAKFPVDASKLANRFEFRSARSMLSLKQLFFLDLEPNDGLLEPGYMLLARAICARFEDNIPGASDGR